MTTKTLRSLRRFWTQFWAGESGQGMTEYATISSILLLGGIGTVTGWPFFNGFMTAYQSYMTSIFFVLNLALP